MNSNRIKKPNSNTHVIQKIEHKQRQRDSQLQTYTIVIVLFPPDESNLESFTNNVNYLTVHGAQKVQGKRQLKQQTITQNQIANGHFPLQDAHARQHHDRTQTRTEYKVLAEVQERQAGRRLDRVLLILEQRLPVPPHLVLIIIKVLDRLIVDQTVDGLVAGLVLGSVHVDAELGAPLGACQSERGVAGDAADADEGVFDAEAVPEDAGDQSDLDNGWHHVEDEGVQDEADASSALNETFQYLTLVAVQFFLR